MPLRAGPGAANPPPGPRKTQIKTNKKQCVGCHDGIHPGVDRPIEADFMALSGVSWRAAGLVQDLEPGQPRSVLVRGRPPALHCVTRSLQTAMHGTRNGERRRDGRVRPLGGLHQRGSRIALYP